MRFPTYRKYDLVWVLFPDTNSRVLSGHHPAVIISHNYACNNSKTIMVVAGTSNQEGSDRFIGQVVIPASPAFGLTEATRFDCGRIMTIDVDWISGCSGSILNTSYEEEFRTAQRTAQELEEKAEGRADLSSLMFPKRTFFVYCPECRSRFNVGISEREATCRNCKSTFPLTSRYQYDVKCAGCGMVWVGETNADPMEKNIARCKCGHLNHIAFDPESETFRVSSISA